jgi:magnesium chelatase family protein
LDKFLMMGELSLDGSLRPIKGALPIAIQARQEKFKGRASCPNKTPGKRPS